MKKKLNLKFLRTELGLNQFELSEATGIKRWRLQLLESGHFEATQEEERVLRKVLLGNEPKLNVSEGGSHE